MHTVHPKSTKRATMIVFFICGLSLSSWVPMVPIVKDILDLNEADLGILLLCIGLGALITMPISGMLIQKIGSRKVIRLGALTTAISLPLLLLIPSYYGVGIVLFFFGSGIGSINVSMNAHGVQLQNALKTPILSSLHGLFSLGGLLGSLGLGVLLQLGFIPIYGILLICTIVIVLVLSQYKNLYSYSVEQQMQANQNLKESKDVQKTRFKLPSPTVFLLGIICFSAFLSEGAMLDWSALFLRDIKNVNQELTGIGYATFSLAMTFMRLNGDRIQNKIQPQHMIIGGSILSSLAIFIIILSPSLSLALVGFALLGASASNIVPLIFSEAGKISGISPAISLSILTTMGYTGQLIGPALLGYIAQFYSLQIAFSITALLMFCISVLYIGSRYLSGTSTHKKQKSPF